MSGVPSRLASPTDGLPVVESESLESARKENVVVVTLLNVNDDRTT
ncbi:MAG: hypothetical protein AAGG50_06015 [Bacteroidota bacterium]